jgi:predicted Zn-dependent protease
MRLRRLLTTVLALLVFAGPVSPFAAARAADDDEVAMGTQFFDELKSQGNVVKSSPLYDVLRPIAAAITKTVQPQYPYPIHFYIVHGEQPNAFAAPGGNVYVVDSLFYFVKNREELVGTICHETSHLLHHDSMKLMKQQQAVSGRALAATILLGPSVGTVLAATALARLDELHYSREAEEAADLTGADTCAKSGFDPWGLVWLFHDFDGAKLSSPPEILSDHPNDAHRVAALQAHFRADPALFAAYSSDRATATRLHVPSDEDEHFYR